MPTAIRVRVPHPPRFCSSRLGGLERSSTATTRSSIALLTIATALGLILYRFPPELYPFYPVCPIREYLHLQCPGCGATRALSTLLHGHLTAALHFNAFAILVLLPFAAIYALICLNRSMKDEPFRWPATSPRITIGLIVLAASFTVFRNL